MSSQKDHATKVTLCKHPSKYILLNKRNDVFEKRINVDYEFLFFIELG